MTQNSVVVIDGSNIATEGRNLPSLAQLDEAVRSFLEEYPHDQFIVVVDATFEHRIDPSERRMYDEALDANELLTPPAGTIGRGDAFILAIAEKANATVFSNDSFQEFHGDYDWLFDEGRLIGGKPVPVIGWVFTPRTPVRGQKSRQATRAASRKRVRGGETASAKSASRATPRRSASSPAANLPMPPPKTPPPGPVRAAVEGTEDEPARATPAPDRDRARRGGRKRAASPSREPVNEGLAFVTFISEHAVGEAVDGEITEFSSHGAYVSVGDARCYVPLKYLGDPPPRAARDVLERGEVRSFVVQAIDGPRRAIDLALPGFEQLDGVTDRAEGIDEDDEQPVVAAVEAPPVDDDAPRRRTRTRPAPADDADGPVRRRTRARKAPAAPVDEPVEEQAATDEPVVEEPVVEPVSEKPVVEAAGAPAPRRRTRKTAAVAAAPEGAAPAEDTAPADGAPAADDGELATPAPRRRTRKAATAEARPETAAPDAGETEQPAPRRRTRKAAAATEAAKVAPGAGDPPAEPPPSRRRRTSTAAAAATGAEAEPGAAAPGLEAAVVATPVPDEAPKPRRRTRKAAPPADDSAAGDSPPADSSPPDPAPTSPPRGRGRRVAAPVAEDDPPTASGAAVVAPVEVPAKRTAKRVAAQEPAEASASKKAPAKRAAAKKAVATAEGTEAPPRRSRKRAAVAATSSSPDTAAADAAVADAAPADAESKAPRRRATPRRAPDAADGA